MGKYDLDVLCGYYNMSLDGKFADSVTAYHITHRANVESIKRDGLTAKSCIATHDGQLRNSAVYLLAAKCDAYDKSIAEFLFGSDRDLVVLQITIPASSYSHLVVDGLFNMSCICADGSYPTGMQYIGNIPATWIK